MKNAIVMALPQGDSSGLWAKSLSELKEIINVKFFIYGQKESFLNSKDDFLKAHPDACILSKKRLIKGNHLPKVICQNYLDQSCLEAISRLEVYAVNMMNRFDPTSYEFNPEYRVHFFRSYVTYWLDLIDEENIDVVLSADIPHRLFDFALFVACGIKKIPFRNLVRVYFLNDSYGIAGHPLSFEPKKIKLREANHSDIETLIFNISSLSYNNAMPEYMKNHQRKIINSAIGKYYATIKRALRKKLIEKNNEVYSFYVKRNKQPQKSNYSKLQYIIKELLCQSLLVRNRSKIDNLISGRQFDKNKNRNYILFALHHQPEATTNPAGGYFHDQLLAIEAIDKTLPGNIAIVVKENYTQYENIGFDSPSAGRTDLFYDRLNALSERVFLSSMFDDTFKLIDGSIATATITGSIGYESILRGKPSLFFGNPWYAGLEGTFRVDTKDRLYDAIKKILDANFYMDSEKVKTGLLEIYRSTKRIEKTSDLSDLIKIMADSKND